MADRVCWLAVILISMATGRCLCQEAPLCDMDKIREQTVDWNVVDNATWYLKMQWTESSFIKPEKASQIVTTLVRHKDPMTVFWRENMVRPGSEDCRQLCGTLKLYSPVLQHHSQPTLLFGLVAVDPRVAVVWIQHGVHTALNVYSKTPIGVPSLEGVQSRVAALCGEAAGNTSSGVYNRFLDYADLPDCFTDGVEEL